MMPCGLSRLQAPLPFLIDPAVRENCSPSSKDTPIDHHFAPWKSMSSCQSTKEEAQRFQKQVVKDHCLLRAARRSTSRSSPPQRKVTGRIRQRRRQSIVKQIQRQRSGSIHVSALPKGKYYSAANGDSEEEEDSDNSEEDDDNRQFGTGYVSLTISEQRKAMAKVLVDVRSGFISPKKPSGMMKSVYDDSLRFALHHTGKLDRTLPRLEIPSLCVGRRLRERRDLMEFEKSPKRSDTNYRLHTHSWNL